jgi:hypothetical protein
MLKKAYFLTHPTLATISPSRPESSKRASSPKDPPCPKQGRSELSLSRGGWDGPNCARLSHPPTYWHAETCQLPWRGPSDISCLSWREWPRLSFPARIERAHSYRARSVSKKGTWPLPPLSSQAARCASTGIVSATPNFFFSILLEGKRQLKRLQGTLG